MVGRRGAGKGKDGGWEESGSGFKTNGKDSKADDDGGSGTHEQAAVEDENVQQRRLKRVMLLNGTMALWPLQQQLAAVQWADVIVGAHGAGLTHALFLRPGSMLVEIRTFADQSDYYELIARLRGLQFKRVEPALSVNEDVEHVIDAIGSYVSGP